MSNNNETAREKVDTVLGMVRPGDLQVDLPCEFAAASFHMGDREIDVLLGRPFLQNFELIYEGSIGRFSLEWQPPSLIYQADD